MQSNNEMLVSSLPKPKKIKQLPPPRVQRSRSCSSLCKRQPHQPMDLLVLPTTGQISSSPTKSDIAEHINENFSPTKPILDDTANEANISTANDSLSDQLNTIFNNSIKLTDEPNPMMQFIKDIMETYQQAIENLTNETVQMRAELTDQKQQIISGLKMVKQQQNNQNANLEIKLSEQKKLFQKQQQQLKQQLTQQFQLQQAQDLPVNCIQYETITNPNIQKTSSPKLAPIIPSKPTIKAHVIHQKRKPDVMPAQSRHAAAGSSKALLKPTLFPPPQETQKERKSRKPRKIDSMILGSSIIKHVQGRKIKQNSGKYAKVCSYPGADTEKVCDHAEVELKYSAPQTVIVHAGGNDMAYGTPADEAVDNIAYLGCELMDRGVKNIAVSAMTPRYLMRNDIDQINKLLKDMCRTYKFDFIEHNNIYYNMHVCQDGVHLNYDGVDILTQNFARYLKNPTMLGYEE